MRSNQKHTPFCIYRSPDEFNSPLLCMVSNMLHSTSVQLFKGNYIFLEGVLTAMMDFLSVLPHRWKQQESGMQCNRRNTCNPMFQLLKPIGDKSYLWPQWQKTADVGWVKKLVHLKSRMHGESLAQFYQARHLILDIYENALCPYRFSSQSNCEYGVTRHSILM